MKSRMHFVQEFRDSFVLERIVIEGRSCNDVAVISKLLRSFIVIGIEQKTFWIFPNIHRFSFNFVIYLVKINWPISDCKSKVAVECLGIVPDHSWCAQWFTICLRSIDVSKDWSLSCCDHAEKLVSKSIENCFDVSLLFPTSNPMFDIIPWQKFVRLLGADVLIITN